ncbi:PREDICTED: general odorant-binding protein 83a-like isoform X1 [Wasmannia auropunctata]|uniref:general odorant-binding protein 83a-like isoform X1 n=1 Tax=Wasmannia auropunctata TaxID=64793 RepID=UPI0005F000A6|nr:PREDICTED: general odorant-binding protein 83a-like isoform X1 [Wasmannia auropunctata]
MKITNILFVTLSLMLVGAQADIKRECRQQTNVSWASLKQLKAGNIEQNDMKLKCYLKCFMVKSGIVDENSNVDVEKALRHLPRNMQESSRKILNRCKSIQAENVCDKAFQIATCYVKAQPEILKSVPLI